MMVNFLVNSSQSVKHLIRISERPNSSFTHTRSERNRVKNVDM
jgi:hypothetical protein